MKKKIILVAGDPNSINSEIIYKAWSKLNHRNKKSLFIIGSFDLIKNQFRKLKFKKNIIKIRNLDNDSSSMKIIDVPVKYSDPFNVSINNASTYVMKSLNLAHKLSILKEVKGMINCPIDKRLLKKSKKIGITELLSFKCNIKDNSEVMLMYNKKLSVVPLTTHHDLSSVPKLIKKDLILKKINTLNIHFKKIFKKKPKIGILGLNPHNGELRYNSEEKKQIIPAISKLKKQKIKIQGPLVADTIFIDKYKNFDVIVGMYHDQVLIPFKTLFHFNAINITLGLNYLRVSPDHGPAVDLIKKNKANYSSLYSCIKFFDSLKK